jgi:hypothetical protein
MDEEQCFPEPREVAALADIRYQQMLPDNERPIF